MSGTFEVFPPSLTAAGSSVLGLGIETRSTGSNVAVAARAAAGAAGHGGLVAALEDFGHRAQKSLNGLAAGAEQASHSLRSAAVCYAGTDLAASRSFKAH